MGEDKITPYERSERSVLFGVRRRGLGRSLPQSMSCSASVATGSLRAKTKKVLVARKERRLDKATISGPELIYMQVVAGYAERCNFSLFIDSYVVQNIWARSNCFEKS